MPRATGTGHTFLHISDLKTPHPFHADMLKFLGFRLLDEYDAVSWTQRHGLGQGPMPKAGNASGEGDHQDQHKA